MRHTLHFGVARLVVPRFAADAARSTLPDDVSVVDKVTRIDAWHMIERLVKAGAKRDASQALLRVNV